MISIRATELLSLTTGDTVRVPGHDSEVVVGEEIAPRSYEITISNGATVSQNRQVLIALPEANSDDDSDVPTNQPPLPQHEEEQPLTSKHSSDSPCHPLRSKLDMINHQAWKGRCGGSNYL